MWLTAKHRSRRRKGTDLSEISLCVVLDKGADTTLVVYLSDGQILEVTGLVTLRLRSQTPDTESFSLEAEKPVPWGSLCTWATPESNFGPTNRKLPKPTFSTSYSERSPDNFE